ncbi:sulfite exporter TauE/SafE family protein [Nakamurella leprariae]|uniref:Probable membrane transporter protein n=1 Tax=Nakamurella leprariae TaxID=2803911 RepID=A0A939BXM8_9ACTN|nr:sulfite exporter TauE/SafE family protein [Nakamurella leprariae]MBM9466150.1 sulfite exporter TauE/SafE family protein [Nakamurella leprariae]
MSGWDFVLLVVAGVGGGLTGSIAGLASLCTYPALLAVGLPPVTANMANTVALLFGGISATASSRPELAGQGPRLRRWCALGLLGGVVGAVLLLLTPAQGFERLVPFLIASASLTILIPRRRPVGDEALAARPRRTTVLVSVGVFAVAVYGGYFGAAAGVLMLAMLLFIDGDTLPRANAAKNAILLCANGIAAVWFMVAGDVQWSAVLPLAIGAMTGSWIGPKVVRRVPAKPLRAVIGVLGMLLAVRLGVQAFG